MCTLNARKVNFLRLSRKTVRDGKALSDTMTCTLALKVCCTFFALEALDINTRVSQTIFNQGLEGTGEMSCNLGLIFLVQDTISVSYNRIILLKPLLWQASLRRRLRG